MNLNKRGQVTLFIILAILIIGIAILFFTVAVPNNWFGINLGEASVANVKNYFSNCFTEKSKDALFIVASQAGYSDLQRLTIAVFYDEKTAYYYKDNKTLIPTINQIEEELAKEIDKQKDYCFVLPESFKDYNIDKTNCSSRVIISDKIRISFDCPLGISKGTSVSRLNEKDTFYFNIDYNILRQINASRAIINEYNSNKPYLCLNCINSIAENNNAYISMLPIIENDTIKESWFLMKENFDNRNISWRFVVQN